MKRNSHIGIYLKVAVVASALLVACNNETEIATSKPQTTLQTDVVSFGISKSHGWAPDVIGDGDGDEIESTRSSQRISEILPLDCEEGDAPSGEYYMYMIEEDCPIEPVASVTRTGEDTTPDYEFGIYAYMGDGNVPDVGTSPYGSGVTGIGHFITNLGLTVDGQYFTSNNEDIYWPGYGWLQFFAYSPYLENGTNGGGLSIAAQENTLPVITYVADAQNLDNHIDLMVGASSYYNGTGVHSENGTMGQVSISLDHILSKIQIKKGEVVSGEITSVDIMNVYQGGVYTFKSSGNGSWVCTGEPTFDYTQSLGAKAAGDDTRVAMTETMLGKPLYLVPQTLSDDALIKISISMTTPDPALEARMRESTYVLTKPLKAFTESWAPNKQYTYIISTPAEVEVDVTDNVVFEDGKPVKKDLVITNTGLAPVFVRVALTGSWFIDREINGQTTKLMVYDWNPTRDGRFEWGANGEPQAADPNSSPTWCKCDDGYYYYMKVLTRGESISGVDALFEKYILEADPPMVDAYLELEVLVQSCFAKESDVSKAWPEEILNMYPFNQIDYSDENVNPNSGGRNM